MKDLQPITVDEWSDRLQISILDQHLCSRNLPGVAVLCGVDELPDSPSWMLMLITIATEKDVVDGEASYIGELLCEHLIVIQFCPFCGEKLVVR